jgi:hypothetical protein
MPTGLEVDDAAFLRAYQAALIEMRDHDGTDFLREMATRGLVVARARVPRGATGELAGSLGMEEGRDERGPYVEFGVMGSGHANEVGFYMEFGTYKDRPRGFMRAALAELGAAVSVLGGSARVITSARSRGVSLRATKRSVIRRARGGGGITAVEARGASRSVTSRFRVRGRRRR